MNKEMISYTGEIMSADCKLPYLTSTCVDNMMAIWKYLENKNKSGEYHRISKWLKYLSTQSINPRRLEIRKQYMWYLRVTLEASVQCLPFTEPVPQKLPELYKYLESNNIAKTQYIELVKRLNDDKNALLERSQSAPKPITQYRINETSGILEPIKYSNSDLDLVISSQWENGQREKKEEIGASRGDKCDVKNKVDSENLTAYSSNLKINSEDRNHCTLTAVSKITDDSNGENNQDSLSEREKSKIRNNVVFKNMLKIRDESIKNNVTSNYENLKINHLNNKIGNTNKNIKNKQLFKEKNEKPMASKLQKEISNINKMNQPIYLNDILNKYDRLSNPQDKQTGQRKILPRRLTRGKKIFSK